MTVLLSDSDGHRCDATCYNAKGVDCDCICGGKHHGKGLAAAAALAGVELFPVFYVNRAGATRTFGFVSDPTDEFEAVKATLISWGAKRVWLDVPEVEDAD